LADIDGSISYYLTHRLEVDRYLADREVAHEAARATARGRFDQGQVRERLLARKAR
jgi:hypothetical protein